MWNSTHAGLEPTRASALGRERKRCDERKRGNRRRKRANHSHCAQDDVRHAIEYRNRRLRIAYLSDAGRK
jgi:hypothetical protein